MLQGRFLLVARCHGPVDAWSRARVNRAATGVLTRSRLYDRRAGPAAGARPGSHSESRSPQEDREALLLVLRLVRDLLGVDPVILATLRVQSTASICAICSSTVPPIDAALVVLARAPGPAPGSIAGVSRYTWQPRRASTGPRRPTSAHVGPRRPGKAGQSGA
jgi:hypothetical protein